MVQKLLANIASALDTANIPYMIIDGQAVLIYGEPRLTRDIDISLGLDDSHLNELLAIADQLGLEIAIKKVKQFVKRTNVLPLYDSQSGFRVDFIFSFSPYEQEALKRCTSIKIENYAVRYASVEDIIIHKIIAGRPRDLEDVKGILNHQKQKIDFIYINNWLKQFSESLGKNFLHDFNSLRQ